MKRIHFNRYNGAKLPPGAKLVTRPSRWGNPYKVSEHGRTEALRMYKLWLDEKLTQTPDFLKPLEGHNLACSCLPGEPCHADIIIKQIEES